MEQIRQELHYIMYITPIEAQQRYGYHPKTLSRWADDGKIKSIKSPGGIVVTLLNPWRKLLLQ